MNYIRFFKQLSMNDGALVGGKTASLGQMYNELASYGIRVPNGFAVTAQAYWYFLKKNNFVPRITELLASLKDDIDLQTLQKVGDEIRTLIKSGKLPEDLAQQIRQAYRQLSADVGAQMIAVAVRSSATAEDLPGASFAGQQETFLNVKGEEELERSCIKSFASLFTDRAIIYRREKGFDHLKVALSVAVQQMVRADCGSSGVLFTLDTESGFKDVIMINAAWGLGELIVQGIVNPDEYWVHKPTLELGYSSIIQKTIGEKAEKMVYGRTAGKTLETVATSEIEKKSFCLSDVEIVELSKAALIIEKHYSALHNRWMPMDIEWAKDGVDQKLYILQARPETIHAGTQKPVTVFYELSGDRSLYEQQLLARGQSIGTAIASGSVRFIESIARVTEFNEGDILVTRMTDPDWVPLMKKAGGLITEKGGRTSHAAIVSRELGLPAVVGIGQAVAQVAQQSIVTLDCSQGSTGFIFAGAVPFKKIMVERERLAKPPVGLYVNCAEPTRAFSLSFLPVDGVGLARIEFIVSNQIKIHPMVAVDHDGIKDDATRAQIAELSKGYADVRSFFIDTLAHGVATIAAAFYPKPVIVRFSDFKSNEYRNLIGGAAFEPIEPNPMLGLRGASRYYSDLYQEAFKLECLAMKKARNEMGFFNIILMVPFVRTIHEAALVTKLLADNGLRSGKEGLKLFMMAEVPSNALLIEQFCRYFDGFSIGSNDLTQMTLGVDRDSEMLASLFDEKDEAVKKMMLMIVQGAKKAGKYTGICGQAPSDYPEIAELLIESDIDSISLNADRIIPFMLRYSSSTKKG